MRLLFLTNYYPPYHLGGYEELCADVSTGLRARGHAVTVVTSDHGVWGNGHDDDSCYRILHPEVDLRPGRATLDFFRGRRQRVQEDIERLRQVVARVQPEALVVWGMWNLPRALLVEAEGWQQPRVVYYVADYWPALPDAYTLHWREPARHWYSRLPKSVLASLALRQLGGDERQPALHFDRVLCVSEAVRRRLIEIGIKPENARVIHNGIDVAAYSRPSLVRPADALPVPLALLYAGRVTPEKGVHTVVEALGILVSKGYAVTLTILGSASREYGQALQARAAQLDIAADVEFHERVAREQMPEILARHDVLVAPSQWAEPLPRIVQEAMAAGLVVVGTPVGGMPEILIADANGLLFPPGDAVALAAQVERLLREPDLQSRLTTAARETVRQQFTLQRMLDDIEDYVSHDVVVQPPA